MSNLTQNDFGHSISLENVSTLQKLLSESPASFIPMVKLSSKKIQVYLKRVSQDKKKDIHVNSLKNLEEIHFKGKIGDSKKREIIEILTTWTESIEIKNKENSNRFKKREHAPVFITLTLTSKQRHADNFIKRNILSRFIADLVRVYNCKHYFWRAESQKNENIHFHVIVDRFVPAKDISTIWNNILKQYGYLESYFEKHNHYNAPSCDVRSGENSQNLISYVLKYMTKSEENRIIDGRIWGMSDSLRTLQYASQYLDSTMKGELLTAVSTPAVTVFANDFHFTAFFTASFVLNSYMSKCIELYQSHLLSVYDFLYNDKQRTWNFDAELEANELIDFETGEIIKNATNPIQFKQNSFSF